MSDFFSRQASSFRDPSGFLFNYGTELYRQVEFSYKEDYELLKSSHLLEELFDEGLLIPHDEVELSISQTKNAYKILKPKLIPFISYPYEWCFSQLKDAAETTLKIQKRALAKGLSMKDASAYNIQFYNGRPLLIDSLSFEIYNPSKPWIAYRQFCQHFLGPLALMAHNHIGLIKLLSSYLDGIPLELVAQLLPFKTKCNLDLSVHLHLHAKSQNKHAQNTKMIAKARESFSRKQMDLLVSGLELAVQKLNLKRVQTTWDTYYKEQHNYGKEGLEKKYACLKELLERIKPQTVWDLGANDGKFSRLASQLGAETLSIDFDHTCVERNYQKVKAEQTKNLLPLHQDLSNPSSSIGWAHSERDSLLERGPADLVLALGLIHHLVISNQIPLYNIAEYFSRLCISLIIEFIPKDDSQVELLLATRENVLEHYDLTSVLQAFKQFFKEEEIIKIDGTKRSLIYFSKK